VWDGLQNPVVMAAFYKWVAAGGSVDEFYDMLIASPPCQTFSMAGNGAGRAALDEVIEAIKIGAFKDPAALRAFGEKHDMRTALVLTPLAHVWRDRPRLVALEQVPTVLPVWEACAEVMRELGYSVKVAVLNAEQYGVPQTRKRAILVARLDGEVQLPRPTHSRYYSRTPDKLDAGVKKWVSMAEALGWTKPGVTFTQNNRQAHQARRAMDQPAPTVTAGHDSGNRGFIDGEDFTIATPDEVAALQSYPSGLRSNYGTGGDASKRGERTIDQPAPTLTSKADRNKWIFRNGNQVNAAKRGADHPAPTIAFGHNSGRVEWVDGDLATKVSIEEAGALQTYDEPFIWCGAKTKQFLQIGNAVPPLLAEAILTALTAPELDVEDLLANELVTA
jgi:DNA (cytosine-5)-methyltransferase 1